MFDRHGLGWYHDPDRSEAVIPSPNLRQAADTLVAARPYIVRMVDESRQDEVQRLLRGGIHEDALMRHLRTALGGAMLPPLPVHPAQEIKLACQTLASAMMEPDTFREMHDSLPPWSRGVCVSRCPLLLADAANAILVFETPDGSAKPLVQYDFDVDQCCWRASPSERLRLAARREGARVRPLLTATQLAGVPDLEEALLYAFAELLAQRRKGYHWAYTLSDGCDECAPLILRRELAHLMAVPLPANAPPLVLSLLTEEGVTDHVIPDHQPTRSSPASRGRRRGSRRQNALRTLQVR
jgi:hypothetical protein